MNSGRSPAACQVDPLVRTEDLIGALSAVDLVRVAAAAMGGQGGGGRPDMAHAGGPDGSKAQAALDAIASRLGAG